jgi:hypothetical protein
MEQTISTYDVPARLPPALSLVLAYWRSLMRGEAAMPFWDDLKLSSLSDVSDRLALVEVFELPERFRFDLVGRTLERAQKAPVTGRFLDECELQPPLRFLRAQCAAAVERAAPTFAEAGEPHRGRLVLPLWGEGQVRMLLVAVG